jgi:hypothetical protein
MERDLMENTISVKRILAAADDAVTNAIITLGGNRANVAAWPIDPEGKPLRLVASIDCAAFKLATGAPSMPANGQLQVFSTYSQTDYFLENIVYDPDYFVLPSGSAEAKPAYTLVAFNPSGSAAPSHTSPVDSIPATPMHLQDETIGADDFPVSSLAAAEPPRGLVVPAALKDDYAFVLQLYSSDFPEPFKDIFYLTDAVGYLFLKKDASGQGVFFVQAG